MLQGMRRWLFLVLVYGSSRSRGVNRSNELSTCKGVNEECAGESRVGGIPELRRIPTTAHSSAQ